MANWPDSHPTMREVLSYCVARTSLDCAFLAIPRPLGGSEAISVLARYPARGPHAHPITRSLRWSVRDAIDAARTLIVVWWHHTRMRAIAPAAREIHAAPRVLITAPIVLDDRRVWGALAAIGQPPRPYGRLIHVMEGLAQQIARILVLERCPDQPESPAASQQGERPMFSFGAPQDVLLHELRTPLSAAGYALEALERLRTDPHLVSEGSAQVERGGRDEPGYGQQVREEYLLDTARLGVMEAQSILRWYSQLRALAGESAYLTIAPVAMSEAIERAMRLLPAAAARVRLDLASDLPPVAADQMWLTQVLLNLLDNAIKYTRPPDCVQVTARRSVAQRVLVSVTAPGSGIPAHEQATIFRPYVRASEQRMGEGGPSWRAAGAKGRWAGGVVSDDLISRGLGLSIARYFVTAMGGDIWVESDGYNSTTLSFTLPIAS
jgi:signal transduction histidine kinase